jgi:putative addiction module CopG family antidote
VGFRTISLAPDLEYIISQKLSSGKYESVDAVMREALRLLQERDEPDPLPLEDLRLEIARAVEQEKLGKVRVCNAEDLKRRVRERLIELPGL